MDLHPVLIPREGLWYGFDEATKQRSMCNCDHMAMQKLHATLIREGTCCTGACCDYCIVGDQNPMTKAYELVKRENGLLVSVKKETK